MIFFQWVHQQPLCQDGHSLADSLNDLVLQASWSEPIPQAGMGRLCWCHRLISEFCMPSSPFAQIRLPRAPRPELPLQLAPQASQVGATARFPQHCGFSCAFQHRTGRTPVPSHRRLPCCSRLSFGARHIAFFCCSHSCDVSVHVQGHFLSAFPRACSLFS